MPVTGRYLRSFFARGSPIDCVDSQENQHLNRKYDRVPTGSDSPRDNDEETVAPEFEENLNTEEKAQSPFVKHSYRKKQNITRLWLLTTLTTTGTLLILVLLYSVVCISSHNDPGSMTSSSIKSPPLGLNCGHSLASAKANNCTFDLLSYSWTPSLCYEEETDREFRAWVTSPNRHFGSFPFFMDRNATIRISDVEAMSFRAGSLAHTTQEEHLGHCTFWMRRIERILGGQGRFTARGMMDDGVMHSLHCSKTLLARLEKGQDPRDRDALHGVIGIGFNSC